MSTAVIAASALAAALRPWSVLLGLALAMAAIAQPAAAVEVERVRSAGGIEAWLVRDHANPIITVRLAFRGGAALDPAGKEGLAEMASSLLDEGAGDLDSQAFQGRLEDLSISLRFDAGRDVFGGRLRTLIENRDAAFGLLRLALNAPRFDEAPVKRIRTQILTSLKRNLEEPNTIARRALARALFPNHPYGRPVRGTLESVGAVSVGDLRRFVAGRLGRDNLVIGVVGDISADELAPLLDRTFGALPAKASSWSVPDTRPRVSGETVVINKPVPQSAIVFGHGGPKRDDPDFYAAYVMNYVLGGGGFTSRLYNEVREKRGLAYSVYSYLNPLDHAALIVGGAGTANQRVADALAVVRAIWRRMAEEGPSAQELANAKTYLTGSFPLRFTSSRSVAGILVAMQLESLGIDYLDRRNGLIEAVTLADVGRVARRFLDPDGLTVVVVGEPDGLAATE
ncbi:MAG TPA: pitrilysin family protein [Rhodospirillales bacterium]|jgi:zinc protease|nr:pitrilysin family protein [Rhodospirillales bacterium]